MYIHVHNISKKLIYTNIFENLQMVTYFIMYNSYVVKVKMRGHCLIHENINHIHQMSTSFNRMLKREEKRIKIELKKYNNIYIKKSKITRNN